MNEIPCDMSKSFYCQIPGPGYPFSSVRRYIYENQGLMRRMYGDQRQSFIVRNEIEDLHEKYDFSPFNGRQSSTSGSSRKSFLKFSPRSAFKNSDDESDQKSTPTPSPPPQPSSSPSTTSTATMIPVVSPREAIFNTTSDYPVETTNVAESLETTTIIPMMNVTEEPIIVPLPMSTSAPEEQPEIDETKKGFNACPVKEEVVAPYWANNTRVSKLKLVQYGYRN